mmetsp:Transcript_35323/g.90336  ORF Transcript_35323/g.90336 Transcript_35323/m.90336 type:complete len:271 (+) Transcript_35323:326-1138(+)
MDRGLGWGVHSVPYIASFLGQSASREPYSALGATASIPSNIASSSSRLRPRSFCSTYRKMWSSCSRQVMGSSGLGSFSHSVFISSPSGRLPARASLRVAFGAWYTSTLAHGEFTKVKRGSRSSGAALDTMTYFPSGRSIAAALRMTACEAVRASRRHMTQSNIPLSSTTSNPKWLKLICSIMSAKWYCIPARAREFFFALYLTTSSDQSRQVMSRHSFWSYIFSPSCDMPHPVIRMHVLGVRSFARNEESSSLLHSHSSAYICPLTTLSW